MADPDRLLRQIREITRGDYPQIMHKAINLAELFDALDGHLSLGGWPPSDWIGPQPATESYRRALTARDRE